MDQAWPLFVDFRSQFKDKLDKSVDGGLGTQAHSYDGTPPQSRRNVTIGTCQIDAKRNADLVCLYRLNAK